MPGESRVLRVSLLDSQLSLQDAPPVTGALGIIGVSGKASLNEKEGDFDHLVPYANALTNIMSGTDIVVLPYY